MSRNMSESGGDEGMARGGGRGAQNTCGCHSKPRLVRGILQSPCPVLLRDCSVWIEYAAAMQMEREVDFQRIGFAIALAWLGSALLSLTLALLTFSGELSDVTEELVSALAVAGMLGLSFSISSYVMASALGKVAVAVLAAAALEHEQLANAGAAERCVPSSSPRKPTS